MLLFIDDGKYDGAKVLIASPSVGNVSQLAVDLLITSINAKKVGQLWHESILPLVGADPYYKSNSLCTSNDIYYSQDKNLLIFQLRASLKLENQTDYLNKLVKWLKELNVSEIVILAGIFAHKRDDKELKSGSFRYVFCPLSCSNSVVFDKLEWVQMKGNEKETNYSCPPLSGAGFTRRLFNICVKTSLKCTTLLYFCLEGDNVYDSIVYLKKINEWLDCIPDTNKLKIPPSWIYLFGKSVPDLIY